MTSFLTQADVTRLLAEPSPHRRADIAVKLAQELERPSITDSELKIAQDIIGMMARDVEIQVRQALADSLRQAERLTHDVALRLANDIEAIALPILRHSPVLSDQDLIDIIQGGSSARQEAIAARPDVSESVSDVLINKASEPAVKALLNNVNAKITETSLNKAVDRFAASDSVKDSLVRRQKLPPAIAERLVVLVSAQLQEYLLRHHELSANVAADIVVQSRERSTVNLSIGASEHEIDQLVAQMHTHGRLTPSVVMRALCMGDIAFFEAAIAMLANIPVMNASILLHNAGRAGLKSLYEKSGLPTNLFVVVRIAIEVIRETPMDGGPNDRERYRARVLERILTQHEGLAAEDLDYLVSKLQDVIILTK
jgi:uncharacterized protein (DUF2336 family)